MSGTGSTAPRIPRPSPAKSGNISGRMAAVHDETSEEH